MLDLDEQAAAHQQAVNLELQKAKMQKELALQVSEKVVASEMLLHSHYGERYSPFSWQGSLTVLQSTTSLERQCTHPRMRITHSVLTDQLPL